MACQIIKDQNNQITKVLDSNGRESKVYDAIASHPLVDTTDGALDIFMNTYLPKIGEKAVWQHKIGDVFTTSYKDALKEAYNGQEIEIGFTNPSGKFFKIISTKKTTNKDTKEGFTNFYIESGILQPKKVKVGTEYRFTTETYNGILSPINEQMFLEDARKYMGKDGVRKDGNTFVFEKAKGTVRLERKNGTTERVKYEDLDAMDYNQLSAKYNDPEISMLESEMYRQQAAYRDTRFDSSVPTRSERELQTSLLTLLTKLGVKTVPLSEYLSKYEIKNGVAPQASALADIANQVIAYRNGEISLTELTEETAHFIVEALPQEQTENVLRNIHRTEEWVQFSDQYREIYRGEYPQEELEQVIRREVLGKVVANSIKTNFSTENKTGAQKSIIDKAKEFVQRFFDTINEFFRPSYKTELDSYLKDIDLMVARQDTSSLDTENFRFNKYRMYNAEPNDANLARLKKSSQKVIAGLRNQIKALSKESATKTKKRKLERATELLAQSASISAISDIVQIAKNDSQYIKNAVEDSRKNDRTYVLSSEENTVYHSLKRLVNPALKELQGLTKKEELAKAGIQPTRDWQLLNREIKETISEIDDLESTVSISKSRNVERIVDEIVNKYNFSADTKENLLKWAEAAEKETNIAHATFGLIAHSNDGMLRTLGYLLRKMNTQAHVDYVNTTKELQRQLRELGINQQDFFKNIMLDGDFILSEYDFNAFQNKANELFIKAFRETLPESKLTDKQILEGKQKGDLDITEDQRRELYDKEKTYLRAEMERPMKEEYYKQYEEKISKLSPITRRVLSDYQSDVSKLRAQATQPDGTMDFTSLSKAQRQEWEELTNLRNEYKSKYDKTGELKQGLEYVYDDNGFIQYENGQPLTKLGNDPSDGAIVAQELGEFDQNVIESERQAIPQRFISDLRKIQDKQGREAAIEFLYANAYIGMSDTFWESQQGNKTLLDKLKEEGQTDLYNKIVQQRTFIKNILKQNSKKNQPSEVDGTLMADISKNTIKEAQQTLEEYYQKAKEILPKEEDASYTPTMESSANKSYRDHLEAAGISDVDSEFEFARQHMTDTNAVRAKDDLARINNFIRKKGGLTPRMREMYQELRSGGMERNDAIRLLQQKAIRDRLLPYYKRTVSREYAAFTKIIQNENVADIVEDSGENIQITPNYSFYDTADNDMVNPNYDRDFRGGYLQPKKDKYKNERFSELFGTVTDGKSTKNPELYEAYKTTMDWYRQGLAAMNLPKGYNMYQKPQVRKGELERLTKVAKDPKSLSYAFKDFFTFTEDDQVKGDTSLGADVQVIPKRFIYKIEDPADVSNELFYSMNLLVQQAYLHRSRTNTYGDIMAVMDTIEERSTTVDKANTSTQAYRMAKSAVDNGLFGVQELVSYEVSLPFTTKKVDLAQVARRVLNFVKLRNLGFNPIIAATSYASARVQSLIENMTGEFMDIMSYKLGAREYRKLIGSAMKDFGEIDNKSKLNTLGQYFGAFDIRESFKNSNYSKLGRLLPKISMGMHTLANYPVYGRNMLATLYNYRIVEGRLINWNDFKMPLRKQGKTMSEIKASWREYEPQSLYNFIDVKDGEVAFNIDYLSSNIDNFNLDSMVDRVRGHMIDLNQRIDGQMNEENLSLAKRHAIFSYATTHRDWYALTVSHRFASRRYDLNSGKLVEGSYMSALSFVKRYLDSIKEDGLSNIIKGFNDAWKRAGERVDEQGNKYIDFDLQQTERNNLKRVGIDWMVLQLALLSSLLISGLGEGDEDDPFALKAANLLALRVSNEVASQQFGLGAATYEVFQTPIIGLQFLQQASNITELFDSSEIQRGSYKGMSSRGRYLTRTIPGLKSVWSLNNLNSEINTYHFYNDKNINNMTNPIYYFIQKNLQE